MVFKSTTETLRDKPMQQDPVFLFSVQKSLHFVRFVQKAVLQNVKNRQIKGQDDKNNRCTLVQDALRFWSFVDVPARNVFMLFENPQNRDLTEFRF